MQLKKDKILAILKDQNETQSDIGERLGVSRQLVGAWIHGERCPKFDTVQRIAGALNCTVFDIADFENSAEEVAAKNESSAVSAQDDFNLARINEIYTCLDRAGRAELLASAEQILKRNTPIIPAPGTMRINTDLTSENLPPKIPTELVARMVQEMDNPTSTPRAKFKGRWLLDKSFICPACGKKFFVSRTESGAKMACPLCGQHVIIP